ncbi:hypothetical protein [Rothia terrae]|uniref:hypothetical protein n=1 Tax=Rothia terrae TaxID=396015 RepID=UPI002882C2E4|nr:hypothetical protein [Rothia terrae]MDT0190584.1 hypothetical protein [Rothia terrae]
MAQVVAFEASEALEQQERKVAAIIAVAAFSCLVVTLQQTLIIPAVPQLPSILGTTATAVSWAVTAALLTGSIATPIISRLPTPWAKRR